MDDEQVKSLQDYLNEFYTASVVKKTDTESIKAGMKSLIDSSPDEKLAAQAKLSALKIVSTTTPPRCFISYVQAKALTEVLNGD